MDSVISQPPRYAIYACSGIDPTDEPSIVEQVNAGIAAAAKDHPEWILGEEEYDGIFVDVVSCEQLSPRHGLDALYDSLAGYDYLLMSTTAENHLHPSDLGMIDLILEGKHTELCMYSVLRLPSPRYEGVLHL